MDPAHSDRGYGHASGPQSGQQGPPASGAAPARPAGAVRKVPFNALPQSSRERFIASVNGGGRPAPALSTPTMKTGAIVLWVLFGLGVAFAVFLALGDNFGEPYVPVQSIEYLLVYMAGFWALAYSVLAIWRRVSLDSKLPFQRGRYVFPTDVVVAHGDTLEMLPMGRVARIDVVHQHQNGRYVRTDIRFIFEGGRTEAFSVFNRMKAQSVLDQLQAEQQRLRAAAQAGDVAAMAELDPFLEARVHGLLDDPQQMADVAAHAQGGPLASGLPKWLVWASLSALAFAVLAVPTFFLRNYLSDEAAFDELVRSGDLRAIALGLDGMRLQMVKCLAHVANLGCCLRFADDRVTSAQVRGHFGGRSGLRGWHLLRVQGVPHHHRAEEHRQGAEDRSADGSLRDVRDLHLRHRRGLCPRDCTFR